MDSGNDDSPRKLRSKRTAAKRKCGKDNDDYKLEPCNRNKKKAILLSSPSNGLDFENHKVENSSVKKSLKTNVQVSKKVDVAVRGSMKLFPIFQSAAKSKEAAEIKSPLQDSGVSTLSRKLRVRLKIRRCKSKRKSDVDGDSAENRDLFEVVENSECDDTVWHVRKEDVDNLEYAQINETANKIHPLFQPIKATGNKKEEFPDSMNVVEKNGDTRTRSLRPRTKKDVFLNVEIVGKDINKDTKKRQSKQLSKLKKRLMKKECNAMNKSLMPNKLHPIFLSCRARTKLTLGTRKVKGSKVNKTNSEPVLNDCVIETVDDEPMTLVEERCKENCKLVESPSSSEDCIILNNGSNVHCRTKDCINEVYFPIVSHVSQIASSAWQAKSSAEVDIAEELEHEDYTALSWNGIFGLLEAECIEYLKGIRSENCVSPPTNNLVVNNNDLPLENLDSDKKLTTAAGEGPIENSMMCFNDKFSADSPIGAVKSWLVAWKLKCSKSSSNDHNVDGDDYESESSYDDDLEKAIIIYGYPGTGKTSAIHSLAQSLDFSVLEVNASSCRTGRHITSRLQEAFHSYGVHNTIFQDSKKALAENGQTDSLNGDVSVCEVSDDECLVPFVKKETTAILNQQTLSKCYKTENERKNGKISKCANIANFFTKLKVSNKTPRINVESIATSVSDSDSSRNSSQGNNEKNDQRSAISDKKVSTVILFDDVDVVFDEDDGFWCAVNTFLKTTKRPVVFTVSRNLEIVLNNLNDNYEVIDFNDMGLEIDSNQGPKQIPDKMHFTNVSKAWKTYFANDMRKSSLHLQFWNKKKISHLNSDDYSKSKSNDCAKDESYEPYDRHELLSINNHFPELFLKNIRQIVHSDNFLDKLNFFAYHHSVDSDMLYHNLFHIIPSIGHKEWKESWHRVNDDYLKAMAMSADLNVDEGEVTDDMDVSLSVPQVKPNISHQRCQKSSLGLKCLSSAINDFSFMNVLKAQFGLSNFLWLSPVERLKFWSAGLPSCMDDVHPTLETTCLEVISTIGLLSSRKYCRNLSLVQTSDKELVSEQVQKPDNILSSNEDAAMDHVQNFGSVLPSFLNHFKESPVDKISSILPLVQQLNTRSIILDYSSFLQAICKFEAEKKKNVLRSRRFLHYFDSISLNLDPNIFDFSR